MSMIRSRWAALGAAVAIALGGGGVGLVGATVESGERAVFVPITPCRVLDTRPGFQVGPRATPLAADETFSVSAHGVNGECDIPAEAVGLSLNVTALEATLPTFLTIWATGESKPNASHLNPSPGQPVTPNAVTTELSTGGQFDIYNKQGTVHLLADVNGYYADHNHDDRYVMARPGYVRLSAFDMSVSTEPSQWAFKLGWSHESVSVGSECIHGRIDLPVGRDITAMSVVYAAPPGGADLSVSLAASLAAPGSLMTGLPPVAVFTDTAPQTSGFDLAGLSIPVMNPGVVLEDYNYVVSVCTKDVVDIVGADVAIG